MIELAYYLYSVKRYFRLNILIRVALITLILRERRLRIIFYNYYRLKDLVIANFLYNSIIYNYDIIAI